jgi:phosphatidylglycerophosphatase A
MRDRLVMWLATGFGVGRVPLGPGLAGSLLGLGYWWLLQRTGHVWLQSIVFVGAVVFAVWVAGAAAELMRRPDPPAVVIDEIVAVPLAVAGLGVVPWKIAVAFVLFRVFDVLKPPPVRQAQHLTGGLGIVFDDLLAAGYACAATHAIVWGMTLIKR